jgi:hypothetical protein
MGVGCWLVLAPSPPVRTCRFLKPHAIPFSHTFAQLPRCKHLFIWSNRSPSCAEVKVAKSWIRSEQSVATHLPLGKALDGEPVPRSCRESKKISDLPQPQIIELAECWRAARGAGRHGVLTHSVRMAHLPDLAEVNDANA